MATNKRITDLTDYKSILPYSSELFGVYQPLIGWKSKRIVKRMNKGINSDNISKFKSILSRYKGIISPVFDGCFIGVDSYQVGIENVNSLKPQSESPTIIATDTASADFNILLFIRYNSY